MITYDCIIEAQEFLVKHWEDDGKKVIETCHTITPYNGTFKKFLSECTPCGGNWGAMILTGIEKLWPSVYDSIPDNMGLFVFSALCYVLLLCGVDTTTSE